MRGRQGIVLVANPETGEVLAVWRPQAAVGRAYPVGSTAKIVASIALLEEGGIHPGERIVCRRVPEVLGEGYHCSHPFVPAPFDLSSALAYSCNYYFAATSVRLSTSDLRHWYAVLGFGTPPGAGGGPSARGEVRIVDTPEGRARAALGEGGILATPAQVLMAYSGVATRGKVFRLGFPGRGLRPSPRVLRRLQLRPETFEALDSGLEACVEEGMCKGAKVPGVRVAGKTGTATALDGSRKTHAWFAGFAPVESPEIALVIFLERGTGARDAAPLAGKIFADYFARQHQRP